MSVLYTFPHGSVRIRPLPQKTHGTSSALLQERNEADLWNDRTAMLPRGKTDHGCHFLKENHFKWLSI